MHENTLSPAKTAALALALILGGCGMSDERLGRFVADPAQYELYTCDQLVVQEQKYAERLAELDLLMKKAETDTGGAVVNAVAYKPEHISVRGSLDQVRRLEVEKKCEPPKPAAAVKR